MRSGISEARLATEFKRLIFLVELERKGQWGKKTNSFIQREESYCLDAEAVASTLWRYTAGVMLNSYVAPVLQARRVHHNYSTHWVLTFLNFVFKNLESEISMVPLHWEAAWTQLEILFGWAARTIKDNSFFVTSMWTAFLLEMSSASILHKLQQVCKVCFMKKKTKRWCWPLRCENQSLQHFILQAPTAATIEWKLIIPTERITKPAW